MSQRAKETTKRAGRWVAVWLALGVLAAGLEPGNALNSSFVFLGALSNIVTPNGDGLNDRAIFCFDNPRASEVSGTVYDLRGHKVSDLTRAVNTNCPGSGIVPTVEKLVWDGRAGGGTVPGGIYIYQIRSEGTAVAGAVMVVR
ncbi:MAG: hypothetical protein HY553_12325 [Elusimicrobia bacterium]|nr:hypothetical protein [Elusimicrobiota bacterium]